MRLGEIKNTIRAALDSTNKIHVDNEVLYGGQAYNINNFVEIIEALDILSKQNWNDADNAQIASIKAQHETPINPTVLTTADFNQLNTYINTINTKLPLYYQVLESVTEDQDEKTINIQLPSNIKSFKELNDLNKRLEDILKLFNVDGQFEFKGFDKGTEWYILVGTGILSYHFLIACLKTAQEYLKTKTEYFKSEDARMAYEASMKKDEKISDTGFEEYRAKWLSIFIDKKVADAIEKIGLNGQTEPELRSQLIKATTSLVKELGEGTEFHLSLNPPDYATEQAGQLVIDYKKIQLLKPENKPKQIASTKDVEKKEEDEK